EVEALLALDEAVDAEDRRVIEAAFEERLALEALARHLVGAERERLHGDAPARRVLEGGEDLAGSALAELLLELEPGELGAGGASGALDLDPRFSEEERRAEDDERALARDRSPVERRSVLAPEVSHEDALGLVLELDVAARDRRIGERELGLGAAPDH